MKWNTNAEGLLIDLSTSTFGYYFYNKQHIVCSITNERLYLQIEQLITISKQSN